MRVFPRIINEYIDGMKIRLITKYHRSGDLVYDVDNKYILKVSTNKILLKNEKMNNDLLEDKLPVSKSIIYIEDKDYGYYLKSKINGKPLCDKSYLKKPEKLIDLLCEGIKLFHSTKLIHGDFCLPNILVKYNKIVGFIDLGACRVGDFWEDYAWSIWSLEYNLNTSRYTELYLKKLGIEFDKEKYESIIND